VRRPNLFIVGAPKCGTTAMAYYLGQHPDIYMTAGPRLPGAEGPLNERSQTMSPCKESNFLAPDLQWNEHVPDWPTFNELFTEAGDEKYVGEASVWYLYSTQAAGLIAEHYPDARCIAMVRNPVDMLHSLHSHTIFNGTEDIEDFESALEAEPRRLEQWASAPPGRRIGQLLYSRIVRYADQIQRFYDALGRAQVHVVVYDDLRADAYACYRDVCAFLEIEPQEDVELGVVNPNKRIRSRRLRQFHQAPPGLVQTIGRVIVPHRGLRDRVWSLLGRASITPAPREPMDPEVRRRLQQRFAPEVDKLSQLLGRDLSAWRGDGRE
jgi:hypothetical protein